MRDERESVWEMVGEGDKALSAPHLRVLLIADGIAHVANRGLQVQLHTYPERTIWQTRIPRLNGKLRRYIHVTMRARVRARPRLATMVPSRGNVTSCLEGLEGRERGFIDTSTYRRHLEPNDKQEFNALEFPFQRAH